MKTIERELEGEQRSNDGQKTCVNRERDRDRSKVDSGNCAVKEQPWETMAAHHGRRIFLRITTCLPPTCLPPNYLHCYAFECDLKLRA